jgi:hypothetical protein
MRQPAQERLQEGPSICFVDQRSEDFHNYQEQHWRNGVTLSQPPCMEDLLTRITIHENSCVGRGEKARNPIPLGSREAKMLHDL